MAPFVGLASWAIEAQWVAVVALLGYSVGLGALIGYSAKRRGVQPSMRLGQMPAPLRQELYLFGFVSFIGAGRVFLLQLAAGWIVAGLVAGISMAVLGAWYDKRYQRLVGELVSALR